MNRKKREWGRWAAREYCIVRGDIKKKLPHGASYGGASEYGSHFYRKSDDSFWIQTRRCSDGRVVYVRL